MKPKSMITSYKVDFGRPGGRPMLTSTTFWSRSGKSDFLMIFGSCTKRPKVMQNRTGVPQRGPDSLHRGFRQGQLSIYPGIHFISTTLLTFHSVALITQCCCTSSGINSFGCLFGPVGLGRVWQLDASLEFVQGCKDVVRHLSIRLRHAQNRFVLGDVLQAY